MFITFISEPFYHPYDNPYDTFNINFRAKSINERNYYGGSAVIVATLHNRTEILQYLTRKKADVNARTNKGYSSLHVAAKNGYTTITQLLIDKGNLDFTLLQRWEQ